MNQKTKEDLQALALGAVCGVIVSALAAMLLISTHILIIAPCK
jgi:hypothetical protein